MSRSAEFIETLSAELRASKKLDADIAKSVIERLLQSETPKKAVEDVVLSVQNLAYKRAAK